MKVLGSGRLSPPGAAMCGAPRELAALWTVDSALYQVIKGTEWRVGATVECEQYGGRSLEARLELDWRLRILNQGRYCETGGL